MAEPLPTAVAGSPTMNKPSAARSLAEFRRGLRPLAGALLGVLVGVSTLHFYISGALMPSMHQEFGWSRTQLSLATMIMSIVGALTSPIVGKLVDRYGARAVAVVSVLLSAAALEALGRFSGGLAAYLGLIFLLSLAGAGASVVTYLCVVSQWFATARGLAIGIVMAATGLSGATAPRLATLVRAEHGWRGVYQVLALLMLAAAPMLLLLLARRRPPEPGAQQPARTSANDGHAAWGLTLEEARATATFWRLALAFFGMTLALTGLVVHFVPMLTAEGLTAGAAASTAGLIGLSIIAGRLLAGALLDRVFAPYVATLLVLVATAGCIILAFAGPRGAAAGALAIGFALGAEVDVAGYMTACYFGTRCYGAIYGWQYGIFAAGAILSPVLVGMAFDLTGGYAIAPIGSAILLTLVAPVLLSLGRYPNPDGAAACRRGRPDSPQLEQVHPALVCASRGALQSSE